MKKTILISGSNGYLGKQLANKLSINFNVIGLVRKIDKSERTNYQLYESTIDDLLKIFEDNKVFCIIHAATVYRSTNAVEKILNTNIVFPVKLYEIANLHGVNSFINIDTFFNQPDINYGYLSEYTLSKKHVNEWLFAKRGDCKLINMKLFHMYGPNDSMLKFVGELTNKLKLNIENIKLTKGEQRRDFIYIDDVVNAFEIVIQNIDDLPAVVEYEVGTGNSVSIRNFLNQLKDQLKSRSKLEFGALEYRENEIMDSTADISELLKLGWSPKVDYIKGIELIVNK